MKITKKLFEQVIIEVAGEDVIPLVRYMGSKKNISEFKIAEDIKVEINQTRNMLYRLYNFNLVSFIRKKDKTKGWYIYYWTFNKERVKELIRITKKNKLTKLQDRVTREKSSQFFSCANKCIRLDFEQATDFQYKCPECGELLLQENNTEKIANLEKEIKELEKELKSFGSIKVQNQIIPTPPKIKKKITKKKKPKKVKKIKKLKKKAKKPQKSKKVVKKEIKKKVKKAKKRIKKKAKKKK